MRERPTFFKNGAEREALANAVSLAKASPPVNKSTARAAQKTVKVTSPRTMKASVGEGSCEAVHKAYDNSASKNGLRADRGHQHAVSGGFQARVGDSRQFEFYLFANSQERH